MHTVNFLTAELAHAENHLARIRRIQAKMLQNYEKTGLTEVQVYERLATNKAYRQLQRDESFYQQMWLRISRHLERLRPAQAETPKAAQPQNKPAPTLNQPCPCGSTLKYKRCCGNPHRQRPPLKAAA